MKGTKNNKKKTTTSKLDIPGVEVEQLEQLLDFMSTHGLEEFEYEHRGVHIRLRKAPVGTSEGIRNPVERPSRAMSPVAGPQAVTQGRAMPEVSPAEPESAPGDDLHIIKSPIVGTFYGSPSPEAAPFVKAGDTVQSGQVVCIVEAMKLMNEIEADVSGEVVRVLVESGQPVEYGQGLFAIRPARKKK